MNSHEKIKMMQIVTVTLNTGERREMFPYLLYKPVHYRINEVS